MECINHTIGLMAGECIFPVSYNFCGFFKKMSFQMQEVSVTGATKLDFAEQFCWHS